VYKAIFSKENNIEDYKECPYWILSHTGKFNNKLNSRGKYIKRFIQEYKPLSVNIEFLCYVSTQKEFQSIIDEYINDSYCMNNLIRQNYGLPGVKRGPLLEEIRIHFRKKYNETVKKNFETLNKNEIVYSRGPNKKIFKTFEEFYEFIQNNIKSKKGTPFNLNWSNDKIKDRFKEYFDTHTYTKQHELEDLCRFNSCSQIMKSYWTDRGWDEDWAIQKIHELQIKNSLLSSLKMTDDRSPSQLNYWIKKGFSEKESKIKRSQFQNHGSYVSKVSINLFWPFYEKYKDVYKCYIHQKADPNSHEFGIWADSKLYCYDFTISDLKLIFEYNGLHVHPRKEQLKDKWSEWRHFYTKETADEVQSKYDKKLQAAYDKGFKVILLWDNDKIQFNTLKIEKEIKLF
jgi:hypothetical protein